ncbi:hypothetical protein NDU88_001170 [Pleurodeles waltl]|uniref:Uncharacterized protein n=1 Tax=Pleurodeles waltl TaxID=8319 RepID=A0AAV7RBT9_PLEWA|nr:hypothetical protein NDU88_001170 [Pleurodeles waltl]
MHCSEKSQNQGPKKTWRLAQQRTLIHVVVRKDYVTGCGTRWHRRRLRLRLTLPALTRKGLNELGQQLRALSQIKDVTASETSSDIGELEDPETATRMKTRNRQPSPGAANFEEDAGPSTGEPRAAPAAREAPNENSSHASGEAWPL